MSSNLIPADFSPDCLGWMRFAPIGTHPVLAAAIDGCQNILGYDIGFLSEEEWVAVVTASLDAMPQGREAAERAAAAKLHELAVAGNWDEWLTPG